MEDALSTGGLKEGGIYIYISLSHLPPPTMAGVVLESEQTDTLLVGKSQQCTLAHKYVRGPNNGAQLGLCPALEANL